MPARLSAPRRVRTLRPDRDPEPEPRPPCSLLSLRNLLSDGRSRSTARIADILPFTDGDVTAGTENEYQTAVVGEKEGIDLYRHIRASHYYQNLLLQTARGDSPRRRVTDLERHFEENADRVWENSWVSFPRQRLSAYAANILTADLRADKSVPGGPPRGDTDRFFTTRGGEEWVRLPISYLLKLSLAEAIAAPDTPPLVRGHGERCMRHFSNDNTSPETFSFYTARRHDERSVGTLVSEETLLRFVLAQILLQFANRRFGLVEHGQRAELWFAPHPPVRQRRLNDLIPDSLYRRQFMSPCQSGRDCGEEKYAYMQRCHKVLSRSQLNAVDKLREAGIITSNLVVLPNMSNISLANNGTHLSLGSLSLGSLLSDPASGFSPADEKYYGDLVIKVFEHFLPLFVGAYSAAPYRLDFWDFHPEKVLGFLPHELDFTHLRMLWRRWKKKARLRFCGHACTPFGPQALDRVVAAVLGLRGDFVYDYRLIDYLVALFSTDRNPGLDGSEGNGLRLRRDLAAMGIFDSAMPAYLPYRQRRFESMGFTGFEGRFYSLFGSLTADMAPAADLQVLITALAYKYVLEGRIAHADIPDSPDVESERRQIFFGTAIGIPTFFVRNRTRNRFLRRILARTPRTRSSRRYAGFTRVHNLEYRRALVGILREDASDLIEMFGLQDRLDDLSRRIEDPQNASAAGRITRAVLAGNGARHAMKLGGERFNAAAETCYRTDLKRQHLDEGLDLLAREALHIDSWASWRQGRYNRALLKLFDGRSAVEHVEAARQAVRENDLQQDTARDLIHLTLLVLHHNACENGDAPPPAQPGPFKETR